MPTTRSNNARSGLALVAKVGERGEAREQRRVVWEKADQTIAQGEAVFGAARGQNFNLHLGHVDAGRTFVPAGLAGHAEFHRVHHGIGRESIRSELAGDRKPQGVLARPRVTSFSLRGGAIGRAHHAALELAAGRRCCCTSRPRPEIRRRRRDRLTRSSSGLEIFTDSVARRVALNSERSSIFLVDRRSCPD